ncbi:AAA family ATPase [Mycobacterium vicinigordonae]|uniref:AAA family ATPase n=1 Tax=Mycobacterium vicinigordonae TaxID=1719132 RepID=UPI001FEA0897|nr:AAA family ATPase [Mycobacterium vicinigordonae]
MRVKIENCHGIHELSAEFDFRTSRAVAIYAPNGMMKTSFARTFADLAKDQPSTDRMFPDRPSSREIVDETGSEVSPQDVVVILSYDEEMGPTEATSTLLVDSQLRKEYEALQVDVLKAKADLLAALKMQSHTRKDVAQSLSRAFTSDDESFFVALLRVHEEVSAQDNAPYADVPYDVVFADKVLALLKTHDFQAALSDYITRYNELLDASTYFSREAFSYYNAANVTKSLADNKFFDANHSILLRGDGSAEEISSHQDLAALIESEKQKITEDAGLRKTFASIEKQLMKNAEARAFAAHISEHTELLTELENVDRFNERVWKSYLKTHFSLYDAAVQCFRAADSRKKEIERSATDQRTQWEEVIDIFNDRFFVPFRLIGRNRERVMLGLEPILKLGFEFEDGEDRAEVDRKELLQVLSTGEKKALYILNVLFEVQARRNSERETIFVIDDIADSFDYKNKYAIIQYLKEMAEHDNFRLIILTHNFDFYRTLESRFVSYDKCLMAQKSETGISLIKAVGIRNPFIKDFKPSFFTHAMKRAASIPFMRNLLEYTQGDDDPDYLLLTSLLHWKNDSEQITQSDLDKVFSKVFGGDAAWADASQVVTDMILQEADQCISAATSINFENKIVLSIAIRLLAEKYMIDAIADSGFTDAIAANQTPVLFTEFRRRFPQAEEVRRILDSVVLMTPEHIHVNSFMYEPILDMADDHLRRLYQDIKDLVATGTTVLTPASV